MCAWEAPYSARVEPDLRTTQDVCHIIFTLGLIVHRMKSKNRRFFLVIGAALSWGLTVNAPVALATCDDEDASALMNPDGTFKDLTCDALPPLLDLSVPAANAVARGAKTTTKFPEIKDTDAPATAPVPLSVQSSDDSVSARTSLQTLRDFNTQKLSRKVQQAQGLASDDLVMPKAPVAAKPAIDVWSSFKADGLNDDSKSVQTGAGLDYKIVKNTSVGVYAKRSETIAPTTSGGDQSEDKYAAYMAFQAFPAVTIDTTTQWESATAVDPTAGKQTEDKGAIIVAPRIGKSFALDDGQTVAPFVTVKREIDLIGKSGEAGAAVNTAGAGVTLEQADSYSLSVTTDVSGIGSSDPASVNSRLQFKLPLH